MSQTSIRQQALERRNNLTSQQVKEHSALVCEHISTLSCVAEAEHIAVYLSHHNEIDLTNFIKLAWEQHKHLYLPVCLSASEPLRFVPYTHHTLLDTNQYGVREPQYTEEWISPEQLDIACVPLVAFDIKRNRIGMGKGFYDRTFAFRKLCPSPLLIGCAHATQQVDSIEANEWDIPLDMLITEHLTRD